MNHLIIRTHPGINLEFIKTYFKKDKDFLRFIEENDADSFIEQYKKDIDDGYVTNVVDAKDIKENWKEFFYNIKENIEAIYSADMRTDWFVYVTYSYSTKIKDKDDIKTIWLFRNPLMAWSHKANLTNPKKLSYNMKMLNDEYVQTMITWAEKSIPGFDRKKITPYIKNVLSKVDIENFIIFFVLFVLMCTNPSIFLMNGHKISQEEYEACTNALLNEFNTDIFFRILKDKNSKFPTFDDFSYDGYLDNIFNDTAILSKFKDFSVVLESVYKAIEFRFRDSFLRLLQNFVYIVIKLNEYFGYTNKEFLLQNINFELLKKIDDESIHNIFELLTKINIDDILYVTDGDSIKLEDPRKEPLDVSSLVNKRPHSPEDSDDYNNAYSIAYDDQIKITQEAITNVAYVTGFGKQERNVDVDDFAQGFYSGFQAGFNDGAGTVEKKLIWNNEAITYDDGYSLGYDKGYDGGAIFRRAETTAAKQTLNLYFNGMRDGYYDSASDINQKWYDYIYDCGFYDKRMEELNSGIGNSLTNSVSNFLKDLITEPVMDKLVYFEDIIHPYRVQSWNSILRFFYFYYFSSYDYIEKPELDTLKPTDVINQSLALLDIKIFLGQQTLPTDITFERLNKWITAKEKLDEFSYPFTSWTDSWDSEIYQGKIWDDLLKMEDVHYFDRDKILNVFKVLEKRFSFDWNWWLYEGCKTPYEFYENSLVELPKEEENT